MSDYKVIRNVDEGRYEMEVEGHLAVADYEAVGTVVAITHTGVPEELGGRGIASKLMAFVLADIKAQGKKVNPVCPFVAAYIDKNPEWKSILALTL